MKIALITGATSGIGYEISKRLLKMNYTVYGIGRNFIKNNENIFKEYKNFIPVTCDLSKLDELEKTLHTIKKIKFDLVLSLEDERNTLIKFKKIKYDTRF